MKTQNHHDQTSPEAVIVHISLSANTLSSSFSLPVEMLCAATERARTIIKYEPGRQDRAKHQIQIQFVAERKGRFQCHAGLSFKADLNAKTASKETPDLILIPSYWRHPLNAASSSHGLIEYLNIQDSRGVRMCSSGTGSTLLAVAGILDGKAATTHWFYFDEMEKRFPAISWKRSHRITQSSNIFCAGSVNAVADLCIYLIEQIYSPKVAHSIANQFSPEARQPLQEQLFRDQGHSALNDELVAEAQDSLQRDISAALNTEALAQSLGLSSRSLQRRFKAATGLTLGQYQQTIRLDLAKSLLRDSNATIEEIALICGFSDSPHLSRQFKKVTQLSPSQYRLNVRGKLFEGAIESPLNSSIE